MLFVVALAVYGVRAIGWPLIGGRDLDEYLYGYIQFLDWHPLLPWSVLFRTPGTPLLVGATLDVAHGALAEPFIALLFAGSVVALSAAARSYGPRAALLVGVALLVYPAWGLMFHELSSETFFSAAFAGWALVVVRASDRPTPRRFMLVGLGVAVLAFIRPGNALLLGFVLLPLVHPGSWRTRGLRAAAFVAAAALPLVAWAILNGVRFGDYALARGGNAVIPFYRAYITDHIVAADNGPASRRLARAMRLHLLTRNPYKGYGVTLQEAFKSGSFRIHEDLYLLSDQVFGWDSNYSILRKAGVEAVRKHPGTYAAGVLNTIWQQLSESYFRPPAASSGGSTTSTTTPTVRAHGKTLPAPTEGQPIPAGQSVWISRPDNSIRDVWTSATHHHFVFRHPRERVRFDRITRRRDELFRNLPARKGNATLSHRLDQLSRWYPRPLAWIGIGLLAWLIRRPRGMLAVVALALAALFVISFNALGLFADRHFALPVAPAFVLFGATALLAPRARR